MDIKLELNARLVESTERRTMDVNVEGDQAGFPYQIGLDEGRTALVMEYRDHQVMIDLGELLAVASVGIDKKIVDGEAEASAPGSGNA